MGDKRETAEGIYYRKEAHPGFWLRLLVDCIDVAVVLGVCAGWLALLVFLEPFLPLDDWIVWILMAGWLAIWFGYFVILKRSRLGTIGYMIGRVRIVDLQGNPASIYSLVLRLGFAFLGPINFLLDLLWLSSDPHRQALRDRFTRTYVVKRDAEAAGKGRIVYRTLYICGYSLITPEVACDSSPHSVGPCQEPEIS